MDKNYRLMVYLGKDSTKLIPYANQIIPGVGIPDFLTFVGLDVKQGDKYIVEMDEFEVAVSIYKTYESFEWIYGEISNLNIYNRSITKDSVSTRKMAISIPDDIIIDPLVWDFMVGTIILGAYPMFLGPTGAGKTVLARALAKALDYDFYYINCGGLFKPKQTLVGSVQAKDATTYLVEAEFLTHFKSDRPTLILLDEISRIPGQAANMMMSITDREQAYVYVEELAQRVYKGKNVIFVATANFGIEYVDTRRLDEAFMDRFIPFVLRYLGESDETKLLNMKIPGLKAADVKNFVKIANILRANSEALGRSISHRRVIDMAKYLSIGFSYGEIVNHMLPNLYVNGSDDRRDQVEQILSSKKINNAP